MFVSMVILSPIKLTLKMDHGTAGFSHTHGALVGQVEQAASLENLRAVGWRGGSFHQGSLWSWYLMLSGPCVADSCLLYSVQCPGG